MNAISRRRFLKLAAAAGGALAFGDLADQMMGFTRWTRSAYAAEPIKVGIIDPLSSPYKTSSIHDVHGATVALEMYNKRGGVLGRQVAIIEADDASNVQTAIKAANKLIKDDRVDFLMGTFNGGEVVGVVTTPFGTTDFTAALTEAKGTKPSAIILNLYGWDLVNALKAYTKLELAKEKIGVGGMIGGEQIGRPLGYANNAGVWGLIWDPKINTESSHRFIQGVIDKYNHTPTSRCYLGYAAMMQILEAVRRAGTTDTAAVIKSLEGHEFDGLKEGRSYFRAWDHQHVQDVLVGQAYGKEFGLGHYQILATVPGDAAAAETTEGKHFGRIRTDPVYRDLSPADRERLIAAIKWVDEQASVTIQVPSQARRSSRIEVTVVTRGGAGPVVGVSLVDSAIRYQARPISASGFKVVGPALVVGSNGKPQAQWAERRLRGSDMGLNTVMITGIEGDQVTQRVDETHTTWVLRAPPEPGAYSVAAAFYYGTEKGRPLGTVVRNGRAEPRGGPGGASGRVMFSDVVKINVK